MCTSNANIAKVVDITSQPNVKYQCQLKHYVT